MRLLININFVNIDTILKEIVDDEELINEDVSLIIVTSKKKNNNISK